MKQEYLSKLDEVIKYYFGDNCELCYYESYDRKGNVTMSYFYIASYDFEPSYTPISEYELNHLYEEYCNNVKTR